MHITYRVAVCRWTLALLAERWIALTDMEQVSMETIRQRLKANQLKPWQQKMWCLGQMDAAFAAQTGVSLYAQACQLAEYGGD